MSVDQWKKNFCNTFEYCFVGWWVKRNNISRSIFWFLLLVFGLFKINFEPTFFQSVFVFTVWCVEYLLIRRVFRQSLLDEIRNLLYDVWFVVWKTMDGKKPIAWLFVRTLSSIKLNVLKIYFFEISFNLKAKVNIFKYSNDVFANLTL